jgi:hypothetical protein
MRKVEILVDHQITRAVEDLMALSSRVDLMSYKVGLPGPTSRFLQQASKFRLILGYFKAEDLSRVRAFVTAYPQLRDGHAEFRVLSNSHAKMFVFHTRPLSAIVGSVNLLSTGFETAVLLQGKPARELARAFDIYWGMALPVKPQDLVSAKARLESGVFETKGSLSR